MQLAGYGGYELDLDHALIDLFIDGALQAESARLKLGLTALATGAEVKAEYVKLAEQDFRRARGLLAAEDLSQWLADREVTVAAFRAHMRTGLAAASAGAQDADPPGMVPFPGPGAEAETLSQAVRTAVLLEGLASGAVRRLLQGAAALELAEEPSLPPSPDETSSLAGAAGADTRLPLADRSLEGLEERAATVLRLRAGRAWAYCHVPVHDVEEVLGQHRLAWAELEYSATVLETEGAAREALLCIRDDHMALADVAAMAGAACWQQACRAEDVRPPLREHLMNSAPGTAVGPVHQEGGWAVGVLHKRCPPGHDEGWAWDRAMEIAVSTRLDRRLAGKAKWHAAAL